MQRISQSTYTALRQIEMLPEDQKDIAWEIYSKVENIQLLQLTPPLIGFCLLLPVFILLCTELSWLGILFCLILWPVSLVVSIKFLKLCFFDWLIQRQVDKISLLIEMDDSGPEAFQNLIASIPYIKWIAEKYNIS